MNKVDLEKMQSMLRDIQNHHDPEKNQCPHMEWRVTWAESELATIAAALLEEIASLRADLDRLTDRVRLDRL